MGIFRLLRLLVIAGVGYLLYRQFFGKAGAAQNVAGPGDRPKHVADDLLVEDPVCHTYVPQQGAESCTVAGETYYFCSPECRKKFQSEPRSNL